MAERLDFVAEAEGWNVYRLMDGTVIRCKLVMVSCVKTDNKGPSGEPLYQNNFQVIQDVEFSDARKREFEQVIQDAARRGGDACKD